MSAEIATPVDEIRQAAERIRTDVAAIIRRDLRWLHQPAMTHPAYDGHISMEGDPQWSGIADVIVGSGAGPHIAGWDPEAGLSSADLLEMVAYTFPEAGGRLTPVQDAALCLARAYLRTRQPAAP